LLTLDVDESSQRPGLWWDLRRSFKFKFFGGFGAFSAPGIPRFDQAIATSVAFTLAANTQRTGVFACAITCKCLYCATLPVAENHHGGQHKHSQLKVQPSFPHESPPESELWVEQS